MMTSGSSLLGALFCLLGTVVLVGIAFVGLRWFLDQGHGERRDPVGTRVGPPAEHID